MPSKHFFLAWLWSKYRYYHNYDDNYNDIHSDTDTRILNQENFQVSLVWHCRPLWQDSYLTNHSQTPYTAQSWRLWGGVNSAKIRIHDKWDRWIHVWSNVYLFDRVDAHVWSSGEAWLIDWFEWRHIWLSGYMFDWVETCLTKWRGMTYMNTCSPNTYNVCHRHMDSTSYQLNW